MTVLFYNKFWEEYLLTIDVTLMCIGKELFSRWPTNRPGLLRWDWCSCQEEEPNPSGRRCKPSCVRCTRTITWHCPSWSNWGGTLSHWLTSNALYCVEPLNDHMMLHDYCVCHTYRSLKQSRMLHMIKITIILTQKIQKLILPRTMQVKISNQVYIHCKQVCSMHAGIYIHYTSSNIVWVIFIELYFYDSLQLCLF